jgi:hypothetical protein
MIFYILFSMTRVELGYLSSAKGCDGSVLIYDETVEQGWIVAVQGPMAAPSPKCELYDRAYVKVFVCNYSSSQSTAELGELAHKLKLISEAVLRVKEFPRAYIHIALQPMSAQLNTELAIRGLVLALLDSHLPMDFVPCFSFTAKEITAINPYTKQVIYRERDGFVCQEADKVASTDHHHSFLQWVLSHLCPPHHHSST